jgi:curli biogenesis system outer membrane secretion channel CsgG
MRRQPRLTRSLLVLTLLALLGSNPGLHAASPDTPTPAAGLLDREVQTIPGPKRTVAVSRFASRSDFNYQNGLADVGGGLSALLTAALVESGRFIVVERETLSDVLAEQNLGATGLTKEEGAPSAGSLLGASLLIKGAVTEFSQSAGGGGFGIGVAGIGLGVKSRKATVGLDIQVIDSTTSQVLASYPVREAISSRSVGLDISRMGVDTDFSKFLETPLGQAARKAINTAVARIAAEAANRPWTGQVVGVDEGEVVINAVTTSGIKVGDIFSIEHTSATFTDPASGRVLGHRSRPVGLLLISAVDDEIAFGDYRPVGSDVPARGDLVVIPR